MKIGDLVIGKKGEEYAGTVGVIYDFDVDNDPVVSWCNNVPVDALTGCGEYRDTLRVVSEGR